MSNEDYIKTGEKGINEEPERVLCPEGNRKMFIYRLRKQKVSPPKTQINEQDVFRFVVNLELLDEETGAIVKCDPFFIRYYNTIIWTDIAIAGKAEYIKNLGYQAENPCDTKPRGAVGMPVAAKIIHKDRPMRTRNEPGEWVDAVDENGEKKMVTYATIATTDEGYKSRPIIKARESDVRKFPPEFAGIDVNAGDSEYMNKPVEEPEF